MQAVEPLKITIEGDFWDCQIYKGYLYLWGMDGSLIGLDWEKLIDEFLRANNYTIAIKYAFQDSDHLYRERLTRTQYANFKQELLQELKKVNKNFLISPKKWQNFVYSSQDNPFQELQTDTEIHYDQIFAATDIGLLKAVTNPEFPELVSNKVENVLDYPILSVRASKRRLALSGGEAGVFEVNLNSDSINSNFSSIISDGNAPRIIKAGVYQVSSKHSSFANWSFSSIYSSSYIKNSYLLAFDWDSNSDVQGSMRTYEFRRSISQSEIFNEPGLSWGLQEKIYKSSKGKLDIIHYKQKDIGKQDYQNNFRQLGSFELDKINGNVVTGGVALFGVVIECDNSLIVIQSDGSLYNIAGAVTRWRVYPRSKRYLNHLHVIHDDRLEIYSFNHDYFVQQKNKKLGIKYDAHSLESG